MRLGIVGLGVASNLTLPAITRHPLIQVAGAVDRRLEARNRFAEEFGCPVFSDLEQFLEQAEVDAVYIATPQELHREHAVLAAEHGKHVLLEKPMALSLEECDAIIEAARRSGVQLVIGPTHSHDPAYRAMHDIIASGQFGGLGLSATWNYTDFLYQPRRAEEIDASRGGGIVHEQGAHQVDIVRLIGGGLVRSVRAAFGPWDQERRTEGGYMAFLEMADGVPVSIVFSGSDRFDSDEFHYWIAPNGRPKDQSGHGRARRSLRELVAQEEETAMKAAVGYGGKRTQSWTAPPPHQPHFGTVIASCERADLRASPDGVYVYAGDRRQEVPVPAGRSLPGRGDALDELYDAVCVGKPPLHDGPWGKATMEVCLGIIQSARDRKEITLQYQVAYPE